jgi:hypothetical protein
VTDNSAEREAEQILKDAARAIQTEQCPQGEECAIHHRVDEEYVQESVKYARFITYSGEYVVVTEDNHIFDSPQFLIKALLGGVALAEMPPRWETSIFHVGDGTIGDLADIPSEERGKSLRYAQTHDVWEAVKTEHNATVLGLQNGLIDVSKPIVED